MYVWYRSLDQEPLRGVCTARTLYSHDPGAGNDKSVTKYSTHLVYDECQITQRNRAQDHLLHTE